MVKELQQKSCKTEKAVKSENKKQYEDRKPIETVKAFKSKDGKSFVVQTIKTVIFPVNYISTILENESPFVGESEGVES